MDPRIADAIEQVPQCLMERSGSILSTCSDAFSNTKALYILGLNPGGCPYNLAKNTVAAQCKDALARPSPWSAYADESWGGAPCGTSGMQPRMLHMFEKINMDPRGVPASNVVFVRTPNEQALAPEMPNLLDACWPFHKKVIEVLGVKIILCLGKTAGRWVRRQTGANALLGDFTEKNERRWRSAAHRSDGGIVVVTATHPSRADWRNPAADPSPLIGCMLRNASS